MCVTCLFYKYYLRPIFNLFLISITLYLCVWFVMFLLYKHVRLTCGFFNKLLMMMNNKITLFWVNKNVIVDSNAVVATTIRLRFEDGPKSQRHGTWYSAAYRCAVALYSLGSGSWLALAIVLRRKLAAPIARATDFGPAVMQPDVLRPVSHTRPSPVIHVSLLIYRPRRDGWLSWPCWLTDSGRLNHKVVTRPACSLAHDRESSPAETSVLTTMLRRRSTGVWLLTKGRWSHSNPLASVTLTYMFIYLGRSAAAPEQVGRHEEWS